jgi:hypothetical protein
MINTQTMDVKLKDFGMSESVDIEGHNAKEDVLYIGVLLFHLIVGPLEYDRGTLTGLWREDIIAYVQANGAVLSQEGIEMLISMLDPNYALHPSVEGLKESLYFKVQTRTSGRRRLRIGH